MTKKTRLLCLFALLLGANSAYAQSQNNDPSMVAGHFEIDTTIGGVVNHINVNYALSPAPFTNVAHVHLNTPNPVLFNVDLLDAENTVIMSWTPDTISNAYDNDLDISSLPSGSYHVNIRKYHTTSVLHTINFTK